MKRQPYLAEIAHLLEAILEETETISQHSGRIPQIELDIVMENIRKLYEAYHGLNKHNSDPGSLKKEVQPPVDKRPEAPPPTASPAEAVLQDAPYPDVPGEQETAASANETLPKPPPSPAPPPSPTAAEAAHEPEPKPQKEPASPPEKEAGHTPRYTIPRRPSDIPSSEKTKPSPAKDETSQSIADRYKSEEKTLNDQVEPTNGLSVADRLQQKKITDLRTALGINDKFLLISELFEGDSVKYNEAIEKLNTFEGNAEAAVHLEHLQQRYGWKEDSPVFQKLRSFIRRRYL
jgi:hypothetical protein